MARVEYGAIVTDISGSIGGITFQNTKSGKIVRLKPSPSKHRTPSQSVYNSQFGGISHRWSRLTLTQQQSWDTWAAANIYTDIYGRTYYLSGFNAFLSVNNWLVNAGNAPINTPTKSTVPAALPTISTNLTAEVVRLDFSSGLSGSKEKTFIYSTPPLRMPRTHLERYYKLTQVITNASQTYTALTSEWNTAHGLTWFGLAASGAFNIGFKVLTLDTDSGRVTAGTFLIGTIP